MVRVLLLFIFLSSLYAEQVKLSLFIFDTDLESLESDEEKWSQFFQEEKDKTKHSLVIYQGDFQSSKNSLSMKTLNKLKVDVALLEKNLFLKKGCMEKGSIAFLGANLIDINGDPFPCNDQILTYEIEGIKVGVFGLSQFDLSLSDDFRFISTLYIAKQKIKELKQKEVDLIIALTNLSENEEVDLARRIEGIDVIISKRKTQALTYFEKETLIHKIETSKKSISRLDLMIEKKKTQKGSVVTLYPTWRMIELPYSFNPITSK